MPDVSVNVVAVLISAVMYMVLGFLWYGPLFGKPWMKLMGYTKEKMGKLSKEGMGKTYLTSFASALVMVYVLAIFIGVSNVTGVLDGMMVGFWVWLGFVATTMLSSVLYGKKPFNLYVIDSSYYLVSLLLAGGIVAGL